VPTYEYACTDCDYTFEQVQSFSDASLTTCPKCGGSLRKLYGAVGVVFKGSGFYRTDSRKADSSSAPITPSKSESANKSDAKTKSGEAAKSDSPSKPSGKSETSAAPSSSSTTTKPSTAGTSAS